nr:DNA-directed DNA polymerase [Tanacetum cinerariifolium]
MEELCQPSINGQGGPIAPIPIQATDLGLRHHMIQQVQNTCQFHGLPGDDANRYIDKFLEITQHMKQNGVADDALYLSLFPYSLMHHAIFRYDSLPRNSIHSFDDMMRKFLSKYFPSSMVTKLRNEITKFEQKPHESLFEAWEHFKLSIDRCPNHNTLLVTQIDTFYNGLTLSHQDTINVAAGDTSAIRDETSRNISSTSTTESPEVVRHLEMMNKNFSEMMRQFQTVKAVDTKCETCGGPRSFTECPAARVRFQATPFQTLGKNLKLSPLGVFSPPHLSKEVDREPEKIMDQKWPEKLGDPGKFLIPCDFTEFDECLALADLGASFNLMPLSIWKNLSLPELTSTQMILELADRSTTRPAGIAKDVFVKVGKFHFPTDFVVVDYVIDPRVPLFIGRPFLRTGRALIAVYGEELTLRVDDEAINFKVGRTSKYSYNDAESFNQVDVIDVACEEYVQEVLGFFDNSKSGNPTLISNPIIALSSPSLTPFEGGDFILEEIEACLTSESIPSGIDDTDLDLEGDIQIKTVKSFIDEPSELELKELPSYLECAFLEGTDKLPVIISKELKDEEKSALLEVLKSHKQAIAWKISDIKGIDPRFYTHKILMKDDFKPTVQHQRRVNPEIHEVIKKEVIKLFDAGMIYPISDSLWVSPIHYVPKKGGMTIVENENNELIPTRLVTGWRVCIDYRKLNDATRKDHFSLPFMDQMLERLAGNEFYCFLDGFSSYFQILIDSQDQEKNTFTYPYGTFAYRRMPFGLCNAPGTFQRCMMAIFHDMIEKTMEVFMDDFLVFGDSFSSCLSHLDTMLQCKQDAKLRLIRWVLLLLEFDIIIRDKKGMENLAVDHLSRLENPHKSHVDPTLLNDFEMAAEGNGDLPVPDLRNIEELCQPSLNGRGGPIAPIAIQPTNFRFKNDMIQQIQNYCQFHGLSGDDANKHLNKFLHVTQSIKVNGVTDDALRLYLFPHSLTHHATAWFDRLPRNSINTFEKMAKMFFGKYFPPSMVTKLRNEITNFRQRPDERNLHEKASRRCYDLIENMTAHHNDWDTSTQQSESSSSITSSSDPEIVALKAEMAEINKNLMRVLQVNQQVKAVTPNCETCGGPHSFNDCPATVSNTQNVYAARAYHGNSYQPQGNHNLLSYRSDNYLGPPGFNQNQNRNNQNQNFYNQNRNQGNHNPQGNNQGRNQVFQGASHGQNQPPAYQAHQALVYQAPVHQPQIPQPQVVTTNEFTNFFLIKGKIALVNYITPKNTMKYNGI